MNSARKKVFVMMSGGVDSSVAAFLLQQENRYDVIGVFIKGYNVDGCQDRDAEDARRVAEQLSIPFYVIDLEAEYKKFVVEYLVDGYRKGITPNPDVMCNKEIKFGAFLQKAIGMGADFVATGHYARMAKNEIRNGEGEAQVIYALQQGIDDNKDQSYFLWTLTQEQLKHCLFPIGAYTKPEIRAIAAKAGLSTAQKKDSQGICFLGNISLREFLEQYLPKKRGNIVTVDGVKVGEHDGAWFYTIGQRHGLCIGGGPAYFVIKKDVANNIVTVSHDDRLLEQAAGHVDLVEVNFMGAHAVQPPESIPVMARIRYRQPLFPATLVREGDVYRLQFDEPRKFVAAGQSAVLYDNEGMVIGGGIIL
jgi:tRNA-specific 2-thiouridylase